VTTSTAAELPREGKRSALAPVRASELEVRPVQWLWSGRVPRGGLTVLAGEPGLGKSLLSVWLASRLSRGELGGTPAASLLLTAEDSREHTVLPRLVAAGAELDQVVFPPPAIDGLERTVRLPDDVGYLRELITSTAAKLVVLTRWWLTCRRRSTRGRINRCVERWLRLPPWLRSRGRRLQRRGHLPRP
jgi:AAA domain